MSQAKTVGMYFVLMAYDKKDKRVEFGVYFCKILKD
jgi:hypothetical protein